MTSIILTLELAKEIVPEDEIYLRVNKDNIASQKVMINNGAYRAGEDEDHFFMRVAKESPVRMQLINDDYLGHVDKLRHACRGILVNVGGIVKMIIQSGSRTDIPAFYSEWFANRLKEGYVYVRNPFNMTYITKYDLNPEVVDLICFCSKNPKPMLEHFELLRPYGMYWYVTITGYGRDIEPRVPDIMEVTETFKRLSEFAGADSMGWRYDPIFLDEKYTRDYHLEQFEKIAKTLDGYTQTAVISFIDLYQKVKKNFPEARVVEKQDRLYLGEHMAKIAKDHGMVLRPCGEGSELEQFGADCSGCMTQPIYEKAIHNTMVFPKGKGARSSCACYLGGDIGMYNTCLHMCRYCYANYDEKTVMANHANHDPNSPLLIGNVRPEDEIHKAEQKSWIDGQLKLIW